MAMAAAAAGRGFSPRVVTTRRRGSSASILSRCSLSSSGLGGSSRSASPRRCEGTGPTALCSSSSNNNDSNINISSGTSTAATTATGTATTTTTTMPAAALAW